MKYTRAPMTSLLKRLTVVLGFFAATNAMALSPNETEFELKLLGKFVFFDNISNPARQSCSSCHDPRSGGTGINSQINQTTVAIPGANPHTVGSLRPPTNAYATFIAPLHECDLGPRQTRLCGGNFWNGRAIGFSGTAQSFSVAVIDPSVIPDALLATYTQYLGPTADQALNPFPNPVEQNITPYEVCRHVSRSLYAPLYRLAWGEAIDCKNNLDTSFKRIGIALAAYQSSAEINSFSSKRDRALKREIDGIDVDSTPGDFPLVGFTDQENLGHALFYGRVTELNPTGKNAQCSLCHSDNPPTGPGAPTDGKDVGNELFQLYADDAYHNIGVPKNYALENPEPLGTEGLAGHTGNVVQVGFRKTPTLRNVDKRPYPSFVKAYMANGWFKSLESVVHFYNTADTRPPELFRPTRPKLHDVTACPEGVITESEALALNCWPAPEFAAGANRGFVGNLGLTPEEEAAIVAYMKTLTDEYTARPPVLLNLLIGFGRFNRYSHLDW